MTTDNQDYPYSTINDPIHGIISFPHQYKNTLKKIIDSEHFQRLRHILQMGLSELVYPSATHTRFSHSIGSAYLALKMATILSEDNYFKYNMNAEEKNKLIKYSTFGALLHDIGHGPFSHTFEKLLKLDDEKLSKKDCKDSIKHEDWTERFLMDYKNKLSEEGIDYKTLSNLINKKHKSTSDNSLNIAADIISSEIDADRMDYLMRDAYFAGVKYGNIESDWIIEHLTIINETGYLPRVGIKTKAAKAAEHYMLSRKLMYQNVALHHSVRIFELLLTEFLKTLRKDLKDDKDKKLKIEEKLKKLLINSLDYMDNKESKENFICSNFSDYSNLSDVDIWVCIKYCFDTLEKQNPLYKIAKILYTRDTIHNFFSFNQNHLGAVSSIVDKIKSNLKLEDYELLMIESNVKSYDAAQDPVLVLDKSKRVSRIQEHSTILDIIGDKTEYSYGIAISQELCDHSKALPYIKEALSKYIMFGEYND